LRVIAITPSSSVLSEQLGAAEWQRLVKDAATQWNRALEGCCSVRFSVAPAADKRWATEDGVNLVVLRRDEWCHNERCGTRTTFPLGALGMTTSYPEGASGIAVREADVELNGLRMEVIADGAPGLQKRTPVLSAPSGTTVPLETVLVHELGHVLGLKDACNEGHRVSGRPILGDCSSEQRERVMFAPARISTPTSADLDEARFLYPLPDAASTDASGGLNVAWPWLGLALTICAAIGFALRTLNGGSRRKTAPRGATRSTSAEIP
jgi:hypothetical protein